VTEQRMRLRSEASHLLHSDKDEALKQAEQRLTEAIDYELTGAAEPTAPRVGPDEAARLRVKRLRDLRMMRADSRGRLGAADGAVADYDAIIDGEPRFSKAYLQKAKVLRQARRVPEALDWFRRAHEVGSDPGNDRRGELRLDPYTLRSIQTTISELEDRWHEEEAIGSGEFGSSHADADSLDSGDGSGRWKVQSIQGYSADSCVYHLVNRCPSQPHPFPHDAWHVNVRFGATVREYTPTSSAQDWEQGRLSLLVKTYADGRVSKRFALLREESKYGLPVPDQPCWVLLSVPILTLSLPSFLEAPASAVARGEVAHVALVVGGTGIAPALQILRGVAMGTQGAFGGECRGTLLYSSRTAEDVLCLDELRRLEIGSAGRISVRHTLTDGKWVSPASHYKWVQGKHRHFTSQWQPFQPESGPLKTEHSTDEAGLRGRIDKDMLARILPGPGRGVVVAVCGPPSMWEDMYSMLTSLGHSPENLVELKALSNIQMRERST